MAIFTKQKKCSNCKKYVTYEVSSLPESCPYCSSLFWNKPNEERILFNLQKEYMDSGRNVDLLDPMYRHLIFYSGNIIKSILRNKHILPQEEFDEKAIDIASKVIERYLKDPEMNVRVSFGGLLIPVAQGVLFGSRKDDRHDSLNSKILDSQKELEESIDIIGYDPLFQKKHDFERKVVDETNTVVSNTYDLLISIYQRIHYTETSKSVSLLYLIAMKNRLFKNSLRLMDSYYKFSGNVVKDDVRKTELVLRDFLKREEYV